MYSINQQRTLNFFPFLSVMTDILPVQYILYPSTAVCLICIPMYIYYTRAVFLILLSPLKGIHQVQYNMQVADKTNIERNVRCVILLRFWTE